MAIEGFGKTRIPVGEIALVVGVPGVVVTVGSALSLGEDNGLVLFWVAIPFQLATTAVGLFQVSRRGGRRPPVLAGSGIAAR
jgi:hypothetical protein